MRASSTLRQFICNVCGAPFFSALAHPHCDVCGSPDVRPPTYNVVPDREAPSAPTEGPPAPPLVTAA